MPFTGFRSSSITAIGANASTTIALPTGAQAGDVLFLFREDSNNSLAATTGFTTLANKSGTFCVGFVEYKTLTSGDIATGSVNVTKAASGAGCCWAVCLKGQPTTVVTTDTAVDFVRVTGGGGTTRSITTTESANAGDFVMLFGAQRDGSTAGPTCSIGSADQNLASPQGSGYLVTSLGAGGQITNTWTFHTSISNGAFYCIVAVRA